MQVRQRRYETRNGLVFEVDGRWGEKWAKQTFKKREKESSHEYEHSNKERGSHHRCAPRTRCRNGGCRRKKASIHTAPLRGKRVARKEKASAIAVQLLAECLAWSLHNPTGALRVCVPAAEVLVPRFALARANKTSHIQRNDFVRSLKSVRTGNIKSFT